MCPADVEDDARHAGEVHAVHHVAAHRAFQVRDALVSLRARLVAFDALAGRAAAGLRGILAHGPEGLRIEPDAIAGHAVMEPQRADDLRRERDAAARARQPHCGDCVAHRSKGDGSYNPRFISFATCCFISGSVQRRNRAALRPGWVMPAVQVCSTYSRGCTIASHYLGAEGFALMEATRSSDRGQATPTCSEAGSLSVRAAPQDGAVRRGAA